MTVAHLTNSNTTADLAMDHSAWQAFSELTAALFNEEHEEAIAKAMVTYLPTIVPVSLCAVSLRSSNPGGYRWSAAQRNGHPLSARLLDILVELPNTEWMATALSSDTDAVHGVLIDPQQFNLTELNPGLILTIPIRTAKTDYGVLLVGRDAKSQYPESARLRLRLLAEQLARALELAALYADTLHRDQEIALIYQTGQRITQLLDMPQLMSQLVAAVSETFGYESVTLLLIEEATQELVVKDTYGLRKERHVGYRIPITDALVGGIVGWVAYHGKPYLATDVSKVKRYLKTVEETQSELAVPLAIQGRVIGVLDVQSSIVGGVAEKDCYILETLADQVAIALENARLYEDLASANTEVQRKAQQLQRLLERTVHIQEQERRRIAADIHDDVSQWLYAAMYEAEAALQAASWDQATVTESLHHIQGSLNQAISDMRKAIFNLWPTSLDEMGLLHSVRSYVSRFEKQSGVTCELTVKGAPVHFAPLARISIYRIIQEALQNVQKHARASMVEISFRFSQARITLIVRDDGCGFRWNEGLKDADRQLGLISMQERARSIGGRLRVRSRAGMGTRVMFEFPRAAVEDGARPEIDPGLNSTVK